MIPDPNELPPPREERVDGPSLDATVWAQLRTLEEGAPGLIAKLVYLYLSTAPDLIEGIRLAAGSGDLVRVHEKAHALRGSSANMGASRLASFCEGLENESTEDRVEAVQASLPALIAEFERVRDLLQAESRR